MQKLIDETSKELWVAMQELQSTFDWALNWKYHRKVSILWTMLDDLIKLDKEIKQIEWKN